MGIPREKERRSQRLWEHVVDALPLVVVLLALVLFLVFSGPGH